MTDAKKRAQSTLLRRRKRTIIALTVALALLIIACVVVTYLAKISVFEDVDGAKYYIKYKGGAYAMYDADNNPVDVEDVYGYYVTAAGTLVSVDAETGAYEVMAVVDTEYSESLGYDSRVIMFPIVRREDLASIEVHNASGSFKFLRYNLQTGKADNSSDFAMEISPSVAYDKELFITLCSHAGYTLTESKISSPIKDERGEFSEYGLVSETRIDEDGEEYLYEPSYYVLTDKSGAKHKVIIGDKLVNNTGYYVQYVAVDGETETKRDAVYVLAVTIGDTILQPIESFAAPKIVYPMQSGDYVNVKYFTVMEFADDGNYDTKVMFSYIDMEDRKNTVAMSEPYVFNNIKLDGYMADPDNINIALYNLYQTEFIGVKKVAPESDDLVEYGFGKIVEGEDGKKEFELSSRYGVSFYFDTKDESGNKQDTIRQDLYISEKNEDGNYYVYTMVYEGFPGEEKAEEFLYSYDIIVEVAGHSLDFVTWDKEEWVNPSYFTLNIAFCEEINIKTSDYEAVFKLDNSATDITNGVSSSKIVIRGTDSRGNDILTFSELVRTDIHGNTWTVSENEIKVKDKNGTSIQIQEGSWYYADNKLGNSVKCLRGYIDCSDGQIYVTPDEVKVVKDGNETVYVRYATDLFRRLYTSFSASTLEDTYVLSEEDEAALVGDPDNLKLTITVKDTEGNTKTYRFYSISSSTRKSYITINGNGGFYVLTNRVNKLVNDTHKFFDLQVIEPNAKN